LLSSPKKQGWDAQTARAPYKSVMHIGYISMVVKLLCIFSMLLVFFAEASDDRLVIDIFDRKIAAKEDTQF
jgi:hypothetical protein